MQEPRVLLLDEPSLGLAPRVVDVIHDALGGVGTVGQAGLRGGADCRLGYTCGVGDLCHGAGDSKSGDYDVRSRCERANIARLVMGVS
jgi:hypothetical protein